MHEVGLRPQQLKLLALNVSPIQYFVLGLRLSKLNLAWTVAELFKSNFSSCISVRARYYSRKKWFKYLNIILGGETRLERLFTNRPLNPSLDALHLYYFFWFQVILVVLVKWLKLVIKRFYQHVFNKISVKIGIQWDLFGKGGIYLLHKAGLTKWW